MGGVDHIFSKEPPVVTADVIVPVGSGSPDWGRVLDAARLSNRTAHHQHESRVTPDQRLPPPPLRNSGSGGRMCALQWQPPALLPGHVQQSQLSRSGSRRRSRPHATAPLHHSVTAPKNTLAASAVSPRAPHGPAPIQVVPSRAARAAVHMHYARRVRMCRGCAQRAARLVAPRSGAQPAHGCAGRRASSVP